MANPDVKYSSVANEGNPFIQQHAETIQDAELATDSDNDDAPQNSGIMIHVVPDTSKCMLLGWTFLLYRKKINFFLFK